MIFAVEYYGMHIKFWAHIWNEDIYVDNILYVILVDVGPVASHSVPCADRSVLTADALALGVARSLATIVFIIVIELVSHCLPREWMEAIPSFTI